MAQEPTDHAQGWDAAWSDTAFADELSTLSYDWLQPTLEFIQRQLSPGSRVLEAGCGPGRMLDYLRDKGHWPVGIDCSMTALRVAREHIPGAPLVLGDVLGLPFEDRAFDGYVSLGVIEHFRGATVDQCLQEARRVLKDGGRLILSVPHIHPLARIDGPLKAAYRTLRGLPAPKADEHEPPGRYYRHDEVVEAVRRNGFEIREVAPLGHEYAFHSFSGIFRKREGYHDVTGSAKALARLCRSVAPWATAFQTFVAASRV